MMASLAGADRVRRLSRPALDPPHSAASPAVPALDGSGSPADGLHRPDSGGRGLSFYDLDELSSDLRVTPLEILRYSRVAQHAREVAADQNEIEMVGSIALLD